ncbi:MAG: hypothetical protein N3E50_03405 [Candidatus Goldbacteria bacterium]|nr:hypothetical protein [Candidatus Goldiibacteriota bacterium]
MKKITLLLFVFVLPFMIIAHPPSEIKITYDLNKFEVYVEVLHKVRSTQDHFIYEMELYVNGKKVIRQDATTQVDNEKQKVIYLIPGLKEGDKLSFWAECNKGGDKKKEITVTKQEGKNK